MLKIWGRASSVNVQKVLWAADELGLTYRRIDAGGKFGGLDTPAYRALNPNGLVPSIEDADGTVVWESNAILRYLAARYGSGRLWPEDPVRRAEADRWMDWALTVIGEPMRILFWGFVRDPVHADGNAMAQAEDRLGEYWARFDAWLAGRGAFVAGDALSMGDIPVGCQMQRWSAFPIARPRLPALEAWHRRLQERPGYRKWVMVEME
ncbi:MAG TPA: glutathione S-transferase family protein [Ferrovibrio sp.]|uniref:glutathione S-transferase family protein n=1 Tax=Ferrovibrio sp. TaxID=1917215 RepID=UPI002ED06AF3